MRQEIRRAMDEADYRREWSTGRAMTLLAAVDLAEQEIDILGDLLAGDGVSTESSSHFPEAG